MLADHVGIEIYTCRPPPRIFLSSVALQTFYREYNCMVLPNLRAVVRVIELGNSSNLQGTSAKQCKSIPVIPYSMRLILQFNSLPFKSKPNALLATQKSQQYRNIL